MKRYDRSNSTEFKVRKDEESGATVIEGYAALFNERSKKLGDLGGAREIIKPGAFRDSLKSDDIRLLINHDPNLVLGRNTAGTLELKETKKGLFYKAELPDTQAAKDLAVSMERGDINQNSFGFRIPSGGNEWDEENDEPIHVVKKARLFDVSVVTYPAYPQTFSKVRALVEALDKEERDEDDEELLRTFQAEIKDLVKSECSCGVNTNSGEDNDRTSDDSGESEEEREEGETTVDPGVRAAFRKRELEILELTN